MSRAACRLVLTLALLAAGGCGVTPGPTAADPGAQLLLEHGWRPMSEPSRQFVTIGDPSMSGGALLWQQIVEASQRAGMRLRDWFGQPGEIRSYSVGEWRAFVVLAGGQAVGAWIYGDPCIPGVLSITLTAEEVRKCGQGPG